MEVAAMVELFPVLGMQSYREKEVEIKKIVMRNLVQPISLIDTKFSVLICIPKPTKYQIVPGQ